MRGVSNRAKWCPRFQDLKISLGSQDFYGISIYGFRDFYGIISIFYGNNRYFTEIIGINILLGISDLGFKQDFSSDFSICVQDFSLLRTPRLNDDLVFLCRDAKNYLIKFFYKHSHHFGGVVSEAESSM